MTSLAKARTRRELIAILQTAIDDGVIEPVMPTSRGHVVNLRANGELARTFDHLANRTGSDQAAEWSHFSAIGALPEVISHYREME
jgi:hypothetical protein